ncbi:hypothetical protein AB0N09_06370 [Streptomyces erythrochromogenes]|uniref:alpha/beta fold hydrolase n=1 Tax=Streptomyces erythrochromogenes TaxID=285574 RepID=UPI00342E3FCF
MADHLTPTPDGSGPAYRTAGPHDGDPLVLLTAPQDTADAWAPVRDALARGRRIYSPYPGGPTGGDRPAPLIRDDLLGFLDAPGLDRVDLIGHSTGALATEHPAPLRRVLAGGHRHHYASPQAWAAALDR